MRLIRFRAADEDRVGWLDGEDAVEVRLCWEEMVAASLEPGRSALAARSGRRYPLAGSLLLPPLPLVRGGLFCIGMNYREHDEEAGVALGPRARRPAIFWKLTSSCIGDGEPIEADPSISREYDWEVELGVVIGRGGRHIQAERAGDHVAGYTVVNDVTARDLQRDHVQWFMGKNVADSTPVGPWVVTVDEAGYPPVLSISLTVNGVEKQRGSTDQMIWDIGEFIALVSHRVELRPGDLFATGTPSGVGFSRNPPEFLTAGDVVCADVERVGTLRNVVK